MSLSSSPPQGTNRGINEGGTHWGRVEQLTWHLLIHFPLTTSPKNSDVNWNPKISESYFWTKSWLSHILPYLPLHKRSGGNGVMWLLYGNLNEKDGCWWVSLHVLQQNTFLQTCQQRSLQNKAGTGINPEKWRSRGGRRSCEDLSPVTCDNFYWKARSTSLTSSPVSLNFLTSI